MKGVSFAESSTLTVKLCVFNSILPRSTKYKLRISLCANCGRHAVSLAVRDVKPVCIVKESTGPSVVFMR